MIKQPLWIRALPSSFVVNVATLGLLGRLPAPGTWGSVAGLAFYTVVFYPMKPFGVALLTTFFLYVALIFCGEAEKRLQQIDPPTVILDEFAAIPICFVGLQPAMDTRWAWAVFVAGFGLFRLFDIWKPFGIRGLQRYRGGLGVLLDDVAAAVATCIVLNLGVWWIVPLLIES
jgi:phosphatidylglycerophosphatase A